MRSLIPCQACGRHHHTDETACPHCKAAVASYPGMGLVRNAKMGALLAFTAATTAACYGTAPPPGSYPNYPRPSATALRPTKQIPTTKGTGYYFVTPQDGGGTGSDTLQMQKAKLDGNRLTLASVTPDFSVTIELPSLDLVAPGAGQRDPLQLADLKFLYAKVRYYQVSNSGPGEVRDLIVTLPGKEVVTGSLRIETSEANVLGGVLELSTPRGAASLYFYVER